MTIHYTFSIEFFNSNLGWAHRYDHYMKTESDSIHYWNLFASICLIISLFLFVAQSLRSVLSKDIEMIKARITRNRLQRYQQVAQENNNLPADNSERVMWQSISTDVFRAPQYPLILSMLTGYGVQIFFTCIMSLVCMSIVQFSPAFKRVYYIWFFMFFAISGTISGNIAARFYKLFKGTNWMIASAVTSATLPMFMLGCYFTIEALDWYERSSMVIPISYMFVVVIVAGGVNTYLVSVGSYLGFSKPVITLPVKTSRHIKPLPTLPPYLWMVVTAPCISILPVSVLLSEMIFLVKSIWRESYYMMFFFMLVAITLMTLACCLVSVLQTFVLLKRGYHSWHWRAYLTGFYVAYYVMDMLQLYYFFVISPHSRLMDTGSMIFIIITVFVGVMMGLIGGSASYLASFFFLKHIYK